MDKGQVEYAVRKAREACDRWNDVTGLIPKFSGYYYELLGVVEDAAKIGARVASGYVVRFDESGLLIDDQTREVEA